MRADRAVLDELYRTWRDVELPNYRRLIDEAQARLAEADDEDPIAMVDRVGRAAGRQLWFLAIVGGSAWKMEGRLVRFAHEHLHQLSREDGPLADGIQVLLGGLLDLDPETPGHAVFSADWYWPTGNNASGGEVIGDPGGPAPHQRLVEQREAAKADCRAVLSRTPVLLQQFTGLLEVTRRYTVIREEQARTLTLGWPLLRSGALRLGQELTGTGSLDRAELAFFLTRDELNHPPPELRSSKSANRSGRTSAGCPRR